jgi:hypothetical protein
MDKDTFLAFLKNKAEQHLHRARKEALNKNYLKALESDIALRVYNYIVDQVMYSDFSKK